MSVKRSCETKQVAARLKPLARGMKLDFPNGEIKWHVANHTSDIELHEQVIIFKDLFRHYEFVNYPLRYNSTKTESEAFIKIFFVSKDNNIYCEDKRQFQCPFNMTSDILAVAYAPTGDKWDGHVFINDDLFWSLRKNEKGKHELFETLIHELGHTHNADHSSNPKSVLYYEEGDNQTWDSECDDFLFDLYKDDRLKALKITYSGLKLMSYANDKKTLGVVKKRETDKPNLLWIAIYIGVALLAILVGILITK